MANREELLWVQYKPKAPKDRYNKYQPYFMDTINRKEIRSVWTAEGL